MKKITLLLLFVVSSAFVAPVDNLKTNKTSPTFTGAGNSTTALATKNAKPDKVYVAMISQIGATAPFIVSFGASPLENTLGGVPVFSYSSIGTYFLTLNDAFPITSKVTATISHSNFATTFGFASAIIDTNNRIKITTRNSSGTLIDGAISFATIEIRVYN